MAAASPVVLPAASSWELIAAFGLRDRLGSLAGRSVPRRHCKLGHGDPGHAAAIALNASQRVLLTDMPDV